METSIDGDNFIDVVVWHVNILYGRSLDPLTMYHKKLLAENLPISLVYSQKTECKVVVTPIYSVANKTMRISQRTRTACTVIAVHIHFREMLTK